MQICQYIFFSQNPPSPSHYRRHKCRANCGGWVSFVNKQFLFTFWKTVNKQLMTTYCLFFLWHKCRSRLSQLFCKQSFCFVYIWKTVNKQLTTFVFQFHVIFMARFAPQFPVPDLLFLLYFHYYSCDVGGWILSHMEITVGSFVDNFQRYLLRLDQIHQTIDCHIRHYKSAKVGGKFIIR